MKTMPKLKYPIIVEGRYDKSAILGIFSGTVITTEGFGIFNNSEKQSLIRKIAADGIILLTDSDGGGVQIRSFLSGILPREKIYQLYIPKIEGKERRKTHRGRAGLLGVEGVGGDVLRQLLMPFTEDAPDDTARGVITKFDMFVWGLSGSDNASAKRDALCRELSLPEGMSAKALLEAVNIVSDRETVEKTVKNFTIN
jgi:ribonuclease M5